MDIFKCDSPLICDSVFDSVLPPVLLGWKNWSPRSVWVSMAARLRQRKVSDWLELNKTSQASSIIFINKKYELKIMKKTYFLNSYFAALSMNQSISHCYISQTPFCLFNSNFFTAFRFSKNTHSDFSPIKFVAHIKKSSARVFSPRIGRSYLRAM